MICSLKFLSPEIVLYLYKFTIQPCMEYCCHVWVGAPSCYLELLDKLQNQIYWTVGPSLAGCLEPLAHCRYVANLSLFYRYYFGTGRCSSELAQLVPHPYSHNRVNIIRETFIFYALLPYVCSPFLHWVKFFSGYFRQTFFL